MKKRKILIVAVLGMFLFANPAIAGTQAHGWGDTEIKAKIDAMNKASADCEKYGNVDKETGGSHFITKGPPTWHYLYMYMCSPRG